MKKAITGLAAVLVAVSGFYAWHQPWGGPLSEAEIEQFLTTQEESGGAAWTDPEAFEAFLRNDDGRPFVMINLMEVREVAEYPDGFVTDAISGAEAERAYGQAVLPLLLARGSYPIARAERYHTVINTLGPEAAQFDSLAVVRYRSRRDLIDMISSEAFRAAEAHKWASLENTLVAPAGPAMSFRIIGWLPVFLLLLVAPILGQALISGFRSRAGGQT